MQIHLLKSKIHRATVTAADVQYEGSLTISVDLMEAVGLHPYERILCGNLASGQRFETYAIPGPRGAGAIILNGATAHRGKPGDIVTIMSFAALEPHELHGWTPRVIVLDTQNQVHSTRGVPTLPKPVPCP